MEFSQWCEQRGIDLTAISADLKGQLQARWREEINADRQAVPYAYPVDAESSIAQHRQRYADAWGGQRDAAIDSTIRAGRLVYADPRHLEHRLFVDHHNGGPPSYEPSDRGTARQADVLAAALAITAGASPRALERIGVDQRTLDAAESKRVRGQSYHSLMRIALAEMGESPNRITDTEIRRVFGGGRDALMGAGPSTMDVAGILSDAANKVLMANFASMPMTWSRIAKSVPLNNFKPHRLYRLLQSGELEIVPAGGEIKHSTLSDDKLEVQGQQRATMIGIDRVALINDDMQAFATVPALLGRRAAIGLEKAMWALLLGGVGTFFSNTNKNQVGAGSELGIPGLDLALSALASQTDQNGDPVFVEARWLAVPPLLEGTARALLTSTGVVGGSDLSPSGNRFAGRGLEVLVSPYLGEAAALPGANDDSYFVFPMAGDFSPVAIGFLDGRETPIVEQAEFDFNRLGIAMRVIYDFGLALFEQRGSVHATGAGS